MQLKFYCKFFLPFASAFFVTTLLHAQVTETEPNNTAAQANTIPLGGNASGAINPAGDEDFYKVTTNGDGQLNLTLDNTGNPDLKVISLYDNNGTTLINNASVGNGIGGLNVDGLAAGTYYIKISGNSGTETGAYVLACALVTPLYTNDTEPDDVFTQANVLALNNSATGHIGYYYNNRRDSSDWFKITTTADGMLQVSYDNTGYPDLKVISLYDNDGTSLLASSGIGNGIGALQKDGLAAGTYYVKISGNSGSEFGAYLIKDTLVTLAQPNDVEPNDIFTQADILLLNDTTRGHIGYAYNGITDTTDWYKVTTTSDGNLTLYFDNTGYNDLKLLSLYDNNGVTLLKSQNIGNGIGGLEQDGLAAGTYYIKVNGNSVTNFGGYTLADSLITVALANDNEPNNTFILAETLAKNDSTTGHIGYYYNNRRDTSDYYKITTGSSGALALTLDNTGNPNISINLYDASGTNMIGGTTVGNGRGGFTSGTLAPGIYYVEVTGTALGNHAEFGPYKLIDSLQVALPVTLINFNGTLNNNEALLTWSTATEINNKGFGIEKSYDGQTFSAIGFVAGKGTSSLVNNYSYNDVKVLSGSNYYRLKQIDIDNNFMYSPVIKIDYAKFAWSVLGNPVSNTTWIQLQVDKKSQVALRLISIDGRIIQTIDKGSLSAGAYSIPLDFGNLAHGVYGIQLLINNKIYSQKVMR